MLTHVKKNSCLAATFFLTAHWGIAHAASAFGAPPAGNPAPASGAPAASNNATDVSSGTSTVDSSTSSAPSRRASSALAAEVVIITT